MDDKTQCLSRAATAGCIIGRVHFFRVNRATRAPRDRAAAVNFAIIRVARWIYERPRNEDAECIYLRFQPCRLPVTSLPVTSL